MKKRERRLARLSQAFALLLAAAALAPFLYVLVWSVLKNGPAAAVRAYYGVFLGQSQFLLRFWKSLAMCLCITAGQLGASVLAGYGFAKCTFPGRDLLFYVLMFLMVLPVQVTLVPNYFMLGELGLLDRYAALILPAVFAPLGTFILRQGFRAIPDEVIEAARLDGCGTLRILARVAVPMNKSGLVCAGILAFLDGWNLVEQPIAYLKDFFRFPLSVALAYVPPADSLIQLVCCVLVILPPLFLFLCFGRELVEGITLTEMK